LDEISKGRVSIKNKSKKKSSDQLNNTTIVCSVPGENSKLNLMNHSFNLANSRISRDKNVSRDFSESGLEDCNQLYRDYQSFVERHLRRNDAEVFFTLCLRTLKSKNKLIK
jgi:hypothetical protein